MPSVQTSVCFLLSSMGNPATSCVLPILHFIILSALHLCFISIRHTREVQSVKQHSVCLVSFVTTESSSTNGSTRLSPGCDGSQATGQNCVKLNVWSLQSMVFSMKDNGTQIELKADISLQSSNMLCPVGKIYSPFPFQQSFVNTQ